MGIVVALETEGGDKIASVEDPTNVLHNVLPNPDNCQYRLANMIDWYGDTTFNRFQTELLRKEWAILIQNALNKEAEAILKEIDDLLNRCASDTHLYVKFYGD